MLSMLSKISVTMGILLVWAMPAFSGADERSNPPNVIVWGFLGLCALIIVAQIAPMIRSLKKQTKIAAEQTKAEKAHQVQ